MSVNMRNTWSDAGFLSLSQWRDNEEQYFFRPFMCKDTTIIQIAIVRNTENNRLG